MPRGTLGGYVRTLPPCPSTASALRQSFPFSLLALLGARGSVLSIRAGLWANETLFAPALSVPAWRQADSSQDLRRFGTGCGNSLVYSRIRGLQQLVRRRQFQSQIIPNAQCRIVWSAISVDLVNIQDTAVQKKSAACWVRLYQARQLQATPSLFPANLSTVQQCWLRGLQIGIPKIVAP